MASGGHSHRFGPLNLAVLVLAGAFVVATGFQTEQLVAERSALSSILTQQKTAVRAGEKVRAQLEVLATGTAGLAAAGNQNANDVVAEMKRLGVTLKTAK